jgi:SAM-dependent methyltransferase
LVDLRCATCGREFPLVDGVVALLPLRLAHMALGATVPARSSDAHVQWVADAPARDPRVPSVEDVSARDPRVPSVEDVPAPDPRVPSAEDPPARDPHVPSVEDPPARDPHVRWVEDEMEWWNPWWDREPAFAYSRVSGLRGRSRERNLFARVRRRLPALPVVIEMGAGDSRTAAGLLGPSRYVATDVSAAALRAGRALLDDDAISVQCDAVEWPFRSGVADVVLVLGVLHHLSDWRAALDRACRTVRPGGFLLLHEAVTKPRVLARFRSRGVDDDWVSPHEGDVPRSELLAFLAARGVVERVRGEESPLRFAFVRYVVHRFDWYARLERSRAMTIALNAVDQLFGRTLGRVFPSLGFNEVTVVWRAH